MSTVWHYAVEGKIVGPVSQQELLDVLQASRDAAAVLVRREGTDDWTPASDFPDLRPHAASHPPPPKPAAPIAGIESDPANPDAGARPKESPRRHRPARFIVRHWRGELSLPMSFWGVSLLALVALTLLSSAIPAVARFFTLFNPFVTLFSIAAIWAGVAIISIWQIVGAWRSADRFIDAKIKLGEKGVWGGAAKLAIVLGALRLVAGFFEGGAPIQVAEAWKIAFAGDPSIPAFGIRAMRNGAEIEISGGIKYGLASSFSAMLDANPRVRVIHLDSPGGRLGEAEKLHAEIKRRGLKTYVSGKCVSACTIAFAAGQERWVGGRAKLGFHAGYFPGVSERGLTRQMKDIYGEAGFASDFVVKALATPHAEIWYPTQVELKSANVVTHVATGSEFAISGYGVSLSVDQIASQLSEGLPLLASLKQASRKDFDAIVSAFAAAFEAGGSEADVMAQGRRIVMSALARFKPFADDDTAIEFGSLLVEQYKHLNSVDATACHVYAAKGDNHETVNRLLTPALRSRENDLHARVLLSSPRAAPSKEDADRTFEKVGAMLSEKFSAEQLSLIQMNDVPKARHGEYCSIAIALFEELLKVPKAEAANALRIVLTGG